MAAVQGLIKKHDAFEGDISVHGERYDNYIFKGDGAFNYFFFIFIPHLLKLVLLFTVNVAP